VHNLSADLVANPSTHPRLPLQKRLIIKRKQWSVFMVSAKQVVLITGAKARLGRAIAERLALAGWDIAVHYRSDANSALETVAALKAHGINAIAVQADLAVPDSYARLVTQAADQLGPLTALINNASLFERDDWDSANAEMAQRHYAVNVIAPLMLSQAFAKQLPQGVKGNIINIIDQRVWKLTPAYISYTLSKSALWTLTQTLAQSLAPNIRVNAVGPGPTLPNASQTSAVFEAEASAVLLQSAVTPQAIADAVQYLLNANFVTGQMIAVDSGQHLGWQTPDAVLEIGGK
jgi:NAD(P)-dependent dehydrogenase (short-subunit alcohol dehydrogenase family)